MHDGFEGPCQHLQCFLRGLLRRQESSLWNLRPREKVTPPWARASNAKDSLQFEITIHYLPRWENSLVDRESISSKRHCLSGCKSLKLNWIEREREREREKEHVVLRPIQQTNRSVFHESPIQEKVAPLNRAEKCTFSRYEVETDLTLQ